MRCRHIFLPLYTTQHHATGDGWTLRIILHHISALTLPHAAFFAASLAASRSAFGVLLPIFHPQLLSFFTTFGVIAAAKGTRTKINDLWMA